VNGTRPAIAFVVNLLARFSSAPNKWYWKYIQHIIRYLREIEDMRLFLQKNNNLTLEDPHKSLLQTGYVLICGATAISWRSMKQILVATSINHYEIITLYEARRKHTWLRRITQHAQNACGMSVDESSTIIHEDNAACIAQTSW
jgi:hypothetical protein